VGRAEDDGVGGIELGDPIGRLRHGDQGNLGATLGGTTRDGFGLHLRVPITGMKNDSNSGHLDLLQWAATLG